MYACYYTGDESLSMQQFFVRADITEDDIDEHNPYIYIYIYTYQSCMICIYIYIYIVIIS